MLTHDVQPIHMWRVFSACGYYERLVLLKSSFVGGSEHRIIGHHISACLRETPREGVLLDVGSSDCRNTNKILAASGDRLRPRLITVDPDVSSQRGTSSSVLRIKHIAKRLEDIQPSDLPEAPNVILFSHSLYYFEDPLAALQKAAHLVEHRATIIAAMWGEECEVRRVACELSDHPLSAAISGESLAERARDLGDVSMSAPWRGLVDFHLWRSSERIAGAAVGVLAPGNEDEAYDHARVTKVLEGRPRFGKRVNVVFSLDIRR